jgi:CheY-like chemotaxis protein
MSTTTTPKHILLVEDALNYQELMLAAFELNHISHYLHIVDNGERALNFLYRQHFYKQTPRPDLIILDLHIPKVNGLELLTIIKQDNSLKTIPVIIFTNCQNRAEIEECYRLQANSLIAKPVDFENFLSVVKKIIDFWLELNVSST